MRLKIFLFLLLGNLFVQKTTAQLTDDCGLKVTNFVNIDPARLHERSTLYTTPYQIRLFIHICADDNGDNLAVNNAAAFKIYLEDTRQFYAPYNICFSLIGIDTIKSTQINYMITDNPTDYNTLVGKLVPGTLNVFFHSTLADSYGNSFNGNAYAIPNYFCSIRGGLVGSSNTSTMAHEMGHDFGLYHTFETANSARETVPRSGAQSNCTFGGDLLCDTDADPNSGSYSLGDYVNASCIYTGTAQDSLGYYYTPPVHNLMTYGRFECRNLFTTDQKDRMEYFITNSTFLIDALNDDYVTVNTNGTINSGIYFKAARTALTIAPSSSFIVNASGKAYFTAGNYINLKPGVQFSGGTGLTDIHINTMCQ